MTLVDLDDHLPSRGLYQQLSFWLTAIFTIQDIGSPLQRFL
jgi:hypothetical protein